MEANGDFQQRLTEAVSMKRQHLEKIELPGLKENFGLLLSTFTSISTILIRKSLIQEDPYRNDKKISELIVPPTSAIPEMEKQTLLSVRLSDYESQLSFLVNYFQFSPDTLTLKVIKKLLALVSYIKWDRLSSTCPDPNTRALAETINKIKSGSDNLSMGIIKDATGQLVQTASQILHSLKSITSFQRESYKLKVRQAVLPHVKAAENDGSEIPDELVRKVKQVFPSKIERTPFYPDLIKEIIREEFSPEGDSLKAAALKKLEIQENRKEKKQSPASYTPLLLESLKFLASAGPYLNDIRMKIAESNQILQSRKLSFSERFRRWMEKVFGRTSEEMIYTVEVVNPRTSTSKIEKIDFMEYMTNLTRRSQVLTNMMKKNSTLFQQIQTSPEDKIFDFLSKNIEEVQLFLRTLPALDAYFREEVPAEDRKRLRGNKLELNAVKNSLVKANQKKHEFVSKKEELEQLKRLGIDFGNS